MSRGNWRYGLAAVGVVISGLLVWGASQYYQHLEESTKDPYAAERYQPARDARLPPRREEQQAQPRPYQPNCQQPQSHEDSDLCAQWGSVKAVQETNRLTRVALRLATLGFLFAVFAALVSIAGTALIWLAWRETRNANQISRDAAVDATRIGEAQVRCYLSIASASAKIDQWCTITVTIVVTNSGQSPARDFRWSHDVVIRTTRPEWEWVGDTAALYPTSPTRDIPVGDTPELGQISIGRGLNADDAETLRDASAVWFSVRILLAWKDVFGNEFVETHHMQAGRAFEIIDQAIPLSPGMTAVVRKQEQ